jgi:hypothetical protein
MEVGGSRKRTHLFISAPPIDAARTIIPIVMEEAAKIVEDIGKQPGSVNWRLLNEAAQSIRSYPSRP